MTRSLGWIAAIGLSVGILSLSLVYTLNGRELGRLLDHRAFQACNNGAKAQGGSSERHLTWAGGDAIDIALPAIVRFRGGEGSDIVVRGSPDLIANVDVRGDRILLDCHRWSSKRDIEVTLPGRAFRRIGLSGSTELFMTNVSQPDLRLGISGSGDINAGGVVDRLTVTISGSGRATLADLAIKALSLRVSGSGKIEAAPIDSADVTISGSGNVRLLTRPAHLSSHISGSGTISQPPLEAAEGRK